MKSCLKHTGLRSVKTLSFQMMARWKNERMKGIWVSQSIDHFEFFFFSVFFDSSDIYSRYQNFPEHKTSKVGFLVVSLKNHRHELK